MIHLIKKIILTKKANINYTWQHKMAFLDVEKRLLGKNTLRGILHDFDKIFLYIFLSKKTTQKIHRFWARHHRLRAKSTKDYEQMVIDWESARVTKPDKPLTAVQTLYEYYPDLVDIILPILKRFKLI